ncbi:hypothetical protein VFPPC_18420 [Pochonia chlamydosporia 170]|uniref:Uncharacterized protein n=1 Tax=Pochonia chlamydosporia 170 TaxID=1380566 RepID=A0A219AN58_METCM|nr:hypothetical protein VFPPC_18420 [Pochonia chlamydosporia 170]OWT42266.1 hypothetical protein VFPPC_18420 [Pochonia chlamydosporia 170]
MNLIGDRDGHKSSWNTASAGRAFDCSDSILRASLNQGRSWSRLLTPTSLVAHNLINLSRINRYLFRHPLLSSIYSVSYFTGGIWLDHVPCYVDLESSGHPTWLTVVETTQQADPVTVQRSWL